MADVLVLVAHPDIARSRVNRAFVSQARALPPAQVEVRDLYALYPDYVIDVEAEQRALALAHTIVWLHPIHWYSMPALMKLWVDEVLAFHWAYGPGGGALAGKSLWLVASTGGIESTYRAIDPAQPPFEPFLPTYRQTAALTGLRFLEPAIFHGAHRADAATIARRAHEFGERLLELAGLARAAQAAPRPEVAADERAPAAD